METGSSSRAEPATPPKGPPAWRRWLPIALVVLASVIGFVSVLAVWVKRQALETETWTDTSVELLENEDIRNAVADFIVVELFANVDVEREIARPLPPARRQGGARGARAASRSGPLGGRQPGRSLPAPRGDRRRGRSRVDHGRRRHA
jgi:hypothetical protein